MCLRILLLAVLPGLACAQLSMLPAVICAGDSSTLNVTLAPNKIMYLGVSTTEGSGSLHVPGYSGVLCLEGAITLWLELSASTTIPIPVPASADGFRVWAQGLIIDQQTNQCTFTGCVSFTAISARFQNSLGQGPANPHRIGISANGHDRSMLMSVVVRPPDQANSITVQAGTGLVVNNVTVNGGTIGFRLQGTVASQNQGDRQVTAAHSTAGTCGSLPVSVIIPKAVGTPHPQFNGQVQGQNMVLDDTTVPAVQGLPMGSVLLASVYMTDLTIRVIDQFGGSIGDLYAGAAITEYDGIPLNVNLSAASSYSDRVGTFQHAGLSAIVNTGSPEALAWPAQPVLAMVASAPPPQNIPVEVDGFPLDPAVANRQVQTTPPATLIITWP